MLTCAPSWPWPLITNGILPARLRIHIRSSTARVIAISRYISTRSSAARPRSAPSAGAVLVAIFLPGRLEVDRLAVDGERRLAERLGQRWMRVDGRADL